MQLKKYRWSKDYESSEEELTQIFVTKNINAERWHGDEYQEYPVHSHDYDTRIWCAEGSIKFEIGDKRFSLQPGDTLDLPAYTPHAATAGLSGCVCYEQHL